MSGKICGEKMEVYSRVVGYYRPVDNWNKGKKHEFDMRKTFKLPVEFSNVVSKLTVEGDR